MLLRKWWGIIGQGNSECRQIDWERDADLILAWKEARTGFPFIDAIMTQLRVEGKYLFDIIPTHNTCDNSVLFDTIVSYISFLMSGTPSLD